MGTKLSLRFENTDSFMAFAEGLATLQQYELQNSRTSSISGLPLIEARKKFEICHQKYPTDAMPTYYLALTDSILGQSIGEGTIDLGMRTVDKKALWIQAIGLFEQISLDGPYSLQDHAGFNRDSLEAQLQQSPHIVSPARETVFGSLWHGLLRWLTRWILWKFIQVVRLPTAIDYAPTTLTELRAINLQRKMVAMVLKVESISQLSSKVERLPQSTVDQINDLEGKLGSLYREIHRWIPKEARVDLEADYWNAMGNLESILGRRGDAKQSFDRALTFKSDWVQARENAENVNLAESAHSQTAT
jgi:hypothetical protein